MTTRELVGRYYESLGAKDDRWKELYAEDAVFSDASDKLNAKGKQAVIQSFVGFLKGVASVRVKRMISEDASACAVVAYEYVNAKGQRLHQDVAELWETTGDHLTSLTIYFDLTAYGAFMRG